jgi:hypothetical protein
MDDKPADTARARQERRLDEALKETFPASDPVAIQSVSAETDGKHAAAAPARKH